MLHELCVEVVCISQRDWNVSIEPTAHYIGTIFKSYVTGIMWRPTPPRSPCLQSDWCSLGTIFVRYQVTIDTIIILLCYVQWHVQAGACFCSFSSSVLVLSSVEVVIRWNTVEVFRPSEEAAVDVDIPVFPESAT